MLLYILSVIVYLLLKRINGSLNKYLFTLYDMLPVIVNVTFFCLPAPRDRTRFMKDISVFLLMFIDYVYR